MTQKIQSLLDDQLASGKIVAWGVWHSSARVQVNCHPEWFAEAQVQETMHRIVRAANELSHHRIQPVRLCWVFDRTRIHLAIRPDEISLGLFAKNKFGAVDNSISESLEMFLSLPEV